MVRLVQIPPMGKIDLLFFNVTRAQKVVSYLDNSRFSLIESLCVSIMEFRQSRYKRRYPYTFPLFG